MVSSDDVKVTLTPQVLPALVYMISIMMNQFYLKLKTMVLKGLLRLEMSILIPFVIMQLRLQARDLHHPDSPWWKFLGKS